MVLGKNLASMMASGARTVQAVTTGSVADQAVNPEPTIAKSRLDRVYGYWTSTPKDAILRHVNEAHYLLLMLSVSVFFYIAYAQQQRLNAERTAPGQAADARRWRMAWQTKQWSVFYALVEMYNQGNGDISWGPWDNASIQRHWPYKQSLRRLTRAGIIPIQIQGGGVSTYLIDEGERSNWCLWKKMPEWAQSKQRAYFDFIVPYPNGADGTNLSGRHDTARRRFLAHLLEQDVYAVSMSDYSAPHDRPHTLESTLTCGTKEPEAKPLETGARSKFKWLLPLKQDTVMQAGKGEGDAILRLEDFGAVWADIPLVALNPHCIVRVEVGDWSPARLDRFVYDVALSAGMTDIHTEDYLSKKVAMWLEELALRGS